MHLCYSFALNLMQCQRRLQIYRVTNIGNVFELSGMAFRLATPYGGLLLLSTFVKDRQTLV